MYINNTKYDQTDMGITKSKIDAFNTNWYEKRNANTLYLSLKFN